MSIDDSLTAAEIEAGFQDALADGNDARDERKFAAAEAAYRRALVKSTKRIRRSSSCSGGGAELRRCAVQFSASPKRFDQGLEVSGSHRLGDLA